MRRGGLLSRLVVLGSLVVSIVPAAALGWNDRGHMIIAGLAYDKLKPEVRARVDALIRLNPEYDRWVHNAPADQVGKIAFMKASTWPDFIKTKEAVEKYGFQDDEVTGPEASRNTGYDDKNKHGYWHYKDLPFSHDGTPTKDPPTPNAETQIDAFRALLASSDASDELKSFDLVWLLHLVGDVHQPLHATSRFTKTDMKGDGDAGGNGVSVVVDGKTIKLHLYWDTLLGTSSMVDLALTEVDRLSRACKGRFSLTTATWMKQSLTAAKKHVYVDPIGDGEGPYEIAPAYAEEAGKVATGRVLVAAARLAAVFNAELK